MSNASAKKTIEIFSPFNIHEPIHRMKIGGLIENLSKDFNIVEFGATSEYPAALIINCLHQDLINNADFLNTLRSRSTHSVVMLLMADFYPSSIEYLNKWSEFVDIFLVPTLEMREFVQLYTDKVVEVLIDPIDFGLNHSAAIRSDRSCGMRVVWFGYPESYGKSMGLFEDALVEMHRSGEIEYHIISKNSAYGESPNGFMHEYIPENFLELLSKFDVCVLSHYPFDFSISTQWKSENKAVLAINRGLPVIASNTAAYRNLLKSCGLENYLFSSKEQLKAALKRLMDPKIRECYLQSSQEVVLERYSACKMSKDWTALFDASKNRKFGAKLSE